MNKQQAKKEIIDIVQEFVNKGLTLGSWGNVSVRVGDTLAITPSGKNYAELKPADIVIIGEKHPLQPSSELALHQKIYQTRKDINVIIHTHSIYATTLACQQINLSILTEDIAQLANGKVIKCAKYALSGTDKLANNAVQALGKGFAVFLANHGAVACGANLRQTLLFAELLEKASQVYSITKSMNGKVNALSLKQINNLKNFYFNCYARRQKGEKI